MGIDELLGRVADEPDFAAELARDPGRALAGYELTTDDLRRLAEVLAARDRSKPRAGHPSLRALLTGGDDVDRSCG